MKFRKQHELSLILLSGEACDVGKALTLIFAGGLSQHVKLVAFIFKRDKPSSVIRRLEARLTTYHVMLERNPGNRSLRVKAETLEKLIDGVARGKVIDVVAVIGFSNIECNELHEQSNLFELAHCDAKILCRAKIGLTSTAFTSIDRIVEIAEQVFQLKTPRLLPSAVLIGYDIVSSSPIFLPLFDEQGALHTLVIGPTGSGKTSLLATIVIRTLSLQLVDRLVVIDPKGDLARIIDKLSISDDRLYVSDLSQLDEDEKVNELSRLVRTARVVAGRGLTLLVVDEAWRLKEAYKEFTALMREARSLGVSLMLASQDPTDFDPIVWNNVSNVIALAMHTEEFRRLLARYIPLKDTGLVSTPNRLLGYGIVWSRSFGKLVAVRLDVDPLVLKHGSL